MRGNFLRDRATAVVKVVNGAEILEALDWMMTASRLSLLIWQAALGPSKDGKSERVVIRVESGGKNLVLGTLSSGKVDQMTLDLIFDRQFTLSHSSSSASVFFCGYRTDKAQEYDEESDEGML